MRGSRVAVDAEHVDGRESVSASIEKLIHFLAVFLFACLVAGQLDLEGKAILVREMNFDVPQRAVLLYKVHNPGKVVPYFVYRLAIIAYSGPSR